MGTAAVGVVARLWRRIGGDIADDFYSVPRHLCWNLKVILYEATSRSFEKGLNVMEVAAITGHKDVRMMQRYTHFRAEDLAKKLG